MVQPDSTDEDGLSDDEISLLCDIGASFPAELNVDKTRMLDRLIASGFVEPARSQEATAKFQLTAKAQKVLSARGVGLDES